MSVPVRWIAEYDATVLLPGGAILVTRGDVFDLPAAEADARDDVERVTPKGGASRRGSDAPSDESSNTDTDLHDAPPADPPTKRGSD